jgi:hypothetical protein
MIRSSRSLASRETPSPPTWRAKCRSSFTTLSPVSLQEQYRCGSFIEGGFGFLVASYEGIRWTQRFTWFGPPERNTLRPWVNGVVLLCLSARLRSLLSVRACVWSSTREFVPRVEFVLSCVSSTRTFYSPSLGSYREAPWPDRWPWGW